MLGKLKSVDVGNMVINLSSVEIQVASTETETGEKEQSRVDTQADVRRSSSCASDVTPTVTQPKTIRRGSPSIVLKSNHEPSRLSLEFDREDSGKSIALITMNKDLLNIWTQFWSGPGKGNFHVFEKYNIDIEVTKVSRDLSSIDLSILTMKKDKEYETPLSIRKVSNTELKIELKKRIYRCPGWPGKNSRPMHMVSLQGSL